MSLNELANESLERSQKLEKFKTVSNILYDGRIPEEMSFARMDRMSETVFGVDIMEIYLDRDMFEVKTVVLSDFSTDGFFWVQAEKEIASKAYQDIFERMNGFGGSQPDLLGDLQSDWCIARYEGEWYRAHIVKVHSPSQIDLFLFDYGTFVTVSHQETRKYDEDDIWLIAPMAIPMTHKGLVTNGLFEKFKKLQYAPLEVTSIQLIEQSCVFEVQLSILDNDKLIPLMDFLRTLE